MAVFSALYTVACLALAVWALCFVIIAARNRHWDWAALFAGFVLVAVGIGAAQLAVNPIAWGV